jgi:hypothetical protein
LVAVGLAVVLGLMIEIKWRRPAHQCIGVRPP